MAILSAKELEELVTEVGDWAVYTRKEMIDWLPTMKKRDLWRAYLEANAVIDQFLTPAMGGITFEALILGRRVISHLDFDQNDDFFGRRPPITIAHRFTGAAPDTCYSGFKFYE